MAIPGTIFQYCGTFESRLASAYLVDRMFTQEERKLSNLIYETSSPPIPQEFTDRAHPLTQYVIETLSDAMVNFVTCATSCRLRLSPSEVDQLGAKDARVLKLKDRLINHIQKLQIVQDLREHRIRYICNG